MIGLARARTALLVIDVQDRLTAAMAPEIAARVIANAQILVETATRLALPIVVTQQYPKGLGITVGALAERIGPAAHRFDKTVFSAARAPEFAALAPTLRRDQWIVVGMEAHVCVYQTARDLVAFGHQVHVPIDAVCSRSKANWRVGVDLIARAGAVASSTEVCVFDLLGAAGSDDFKALSRLIK